MKVTVDTNLLVRAVLNDDPGQSPRAVKILTEATLVAVPITCLCEFVWVLLRGAHLTKEQVVTAITALIAVDNAVVNQPAVRAGLAILEAGGDFADGVIAYEGNWQSNYVTH